jgi:hypothetical protein
MKYDTPGNLSPREQDHIDSAIRGHQAEQRNLFNIAQAESEHEGSIVVAYQLPRDWHSASERERRLWALKHEKLRLQRQAKRAWKISGTLYHAAQGDAEYLEFARAQRERASMLSRRARECDDVIVRLLGDKARDDARKQAREERREEKRVGLTIVTDEGGPQ